MTEKKINIAIRNLESALQKYDEGNIMPDLQAEIDAFNDVRNELSYSAMTDEESEKIDKMNFKIKDFIVRIMSDIDIVLQKYTENDQENTLDGLNERVLTVCELLRGLPPEEARKLVPQIEAMYGIVNQLAESIDTKKKKVEKELHDLRNTNKANHSYKNFEDG